MAQTPPTACPNCGSPIVEDQRFCTNCGSTMEPGATKQTLAAFQPPQASVPAILPDRPGLTESAFAETLPAAQPSSPPASIYAQEGVITPPPPPYAQYSLISPDGSQNYPQSSGSSPDYFSPPAVGAYQQVPMYAQKPQRGHGCLIASIILLLILATGIGSSVFVYSRLNTNSNSHNGNTANNGSHSNSNNGGPSGSTNEITPTTGVSSSEQINLKITYASVNITITSAQEASSFSDDNSSPGSAGVVRVNLQENNTTTQNPDYLESDVMLLVLPGSSTIQVSNSEQSISPAAGVNHPNWLDFPINNQVSLNQLTLRIGAANENQMNVPLQPHANLSKYQEKTSSPNAQFKYAGVNWTIKSAMLSYSYADQQATAGNLYAILSFSALNTTSTDFIDNAADYMRLQAGGNTVPPDETTTLPSDIAANATASGVVAFLVPQDATSFTLIMLAQQDTDNTQSTTQATQSFSIR